jgi:Protein of unknown function (DUF2971)
VTLMEDIDVRRAFEPLYDDIKPEVQFFKVQPLLAHYTTIQTIEKIVTSKEIWFSNPLYMNDIEEVRFGLIESDRLLKSDKAIADACITPQRKAILFSAFNDYSRFYIENHLADTYVLCLSEHKANDNDGLLSMWRGYGGNGNGAALVIDTAKLNNLSTSPLILARVEYGTTVERQAWLTGLLKKFSEILILQKLPDELLHVAACALLDRLKLFALFSKHRGFDEEEEWRIVYMRDRDQNRVFDPMFGYLTGPRGIEAKLKLKIAHHPGATAEDLSLAKIVERIILGPSISSPMASMTFKRMLIEHGEPELAQRVVASSIPFRHRI